MVLKLTYVDLHTSWSNLMVVSGTNHIFQLIMGGGGSIVVLLHWQIKLFLINLGLLPKLAGTCTQDAQLYYENVAPLHVLPTPLITILIPYTHIGMLYVDDVTFSS